MSIAPNDMLRYLVTAQETVDMKRFVNLGVTKNASVDDAEKLAFFESTIAELQTAKS